MTKIDPIKSGLNGLGVGFFAGSTFALAKKDEEITDFIKQTIKPLRPKNTLNKYEELKYIPDYLSKIFLKTPEKIKSFLKSNVQEDKMIKRFVVIFSLSLSLISYLVAKNKEKKYLLKTNKTP